MVLQRRFLVILLLLFPCCIFAQRSSPFPNREFNLYIDNFLIHDTSNFSLLENEVLNYRNLERIDSIVYPRKQKKNYFVRKLRRQNFVHVNKNDFYLTLDPMFNLNGGLDLQDTLNEKLITNSRGVSVRGNIGKLSRYTRRRVLEIWNSMGEA